MKKYVFFSVLLAFTIAGWSQQQTRSPYEGAWKLVGLTSTAGNTVKHFKNTEFGDQVKMWTGNHFSFTGIVKNGNTDIDLFGYGTYTLNGNEYVESIVLHSVKSLINTNYKCILEFRNDTLYQIMNDIDQSGKEVKGSFTTEKYIKLN